VDAFQFKSAQFTLINRVNNMAAETSRRLTVRDLPRLPNLLSTQTLLEIITENRRGQEI
jgi:hypothetical protein